MLSADLHASRDPVFDDTAPSLDGGVAHVIDPPSDHRWSRLGRALPGLTGALLINGAAIVAFAILWRGMAKDLTTPEGIPVEIVDRMPGDGGVPPAPAPPAPAPAAPKAAENSAPAPAPPPAPLPSADVLRQALALPAMPEAEAPPASAAPEAPAGTTAATGEKPPVSRLAEPPPEPKAAATQTAPDEKPNAAAEADKPPLPEPPPPAPPAPDVLTATQAEIAVPAPSHAPEATPPAKTSAPNPDHSRTAAASLAAALPTSSLSMPSTFRAMLSSQGASSGEEYKGVVFGSLSRATQAVSEEARRRRLKGQVVVSIALDAGGGIARAVIVQSSGSAEVDALALDLVRRAAPFPRPPAGTPRSFTPVISIGEE